MMLPPFKRLRTEDSELSRVQDNVADEFERTRDILNAGLRYDNRVGELVTVDITPPDDWIPLGALQNGWSLYVDPSFPPPAQRKGEDGWVETRGLITRATAATTQFAVPIYPIALNANWRVPCLTDTGLGQLQANNPGLFFIAGGTVFVMLTSLRYPAEDRSPPHWATPGTLTLSANFATDVTSVEVVSCLDKTTGVSLSGIRARWTSSVTRGVRTVSLLNMPGLVPLRTYSVKFFVAGT